MKDIDLDLDLDLCQDCLNGMHLAPLMEHTLCSCPCHGPQSKPGRQGEAYYSSLTAPATHATPTSHATPTTPATIITGNACLSASPPTLASVAEMIGVVAAIFGLVGLIGLLAMMLGRVVQMLTTAVRG